MSDKITADIRKNQQIELDITEINNLGAGVGHLPDGRVVFVRGALTGERVRATVIKVASSFLVARLDAVLASSPYRLPDDAPDCGASENCGGCIYRHITYEHELELKQNYVKNAFCKVGLSDVTVEPVRSTGACHGYRNKAQYPVGKMGGKTIAGFYATKSHNILPAEGCLLQPPVFSDIVKSICAFCDEKNISTYDEQSGKGLLRHIYLREGVKTGQIMVCLVINGNKLPHADELCTRLTAEFPAICSIMLSHNEKNTNVVLGDTYTTLFGAPYMEDVLCELRFRIAPDAFYQVNHDGAELLYGIGADKADLQGNETILDLYCGIGTIGMSMAHKAKSLIGIEIVPAAVECAGQNAAANGITHATFVCADAGDPASMLSCLGDITPDLVILDPPRKGSTNELIDALAARNIRRVVYISCDADTLARDCVRFRENGYEIGTVTPVDMFPRTGHVETVCLLSKLNTKQHIEINLDMDELDLTDAEKKATYQEIKDYVLEHGGLKVSSLYIAQVKQQCGIIERENYNKPKSEDAKQPQCPPDKEKAIKEALKHFGMI